MSGPTYDATEYSKMGYLYKKIAKGDPLAFPSYADRNASEAPGASSRINVFSSNIYSQSILGSGSDLNSIFGSTFPGLLVLNTTADFTAATGDMPNPSNNNSTIDLNLFKYMIQFFTYI